MAKLTKEVFIEALKGMTLLEIKELVDGIKEEFGVDPSSFVSSATVGNNEAAINKAEDNKSTVVLKSFSGKSIVPIIKEIRQITNLTIIESKKLAETPNAVIKKDIDKEEAESIKKKLEELGATVELE